MSVEAATPRRARSTRTFMVERLSAAEDSAVVPDGRRPSGYGADARGGLGCSALSVELNTKAESDCLITQTIRGARGLRKKGHELSLPSTRVTSWFPEHLSQVPLKFWIVDVKMKTVPSLCEDNINSADAIVSAYQLFRRLDPFYSVRLL
uniref:Uncharacterized protein n=1 Tax=Steinernema glaseri TaxID=37863 RepID=A0A1I7ZZ00_9BILA